MNRYPVAEEAELERAEALWRAREREREAEMDRLDEAMARAEHVEADEEEDE